MSTTNFTVDTFFERLDFVVNDKLHGNWADLSRKSGLAASAIHKIKNGTEPKISSLKRICDALNVSSDWLLTGKEPAPAKELISVQNPNEFEGKFKNDRLALAIETVEDVLAESKRTMNPDKKATLIMAVYDLYQDEEKPAKQPVLQLIRAAA